MFERDPREEQAFSKYTGLKIGAILMPILVLFIYFGKADMGLTLFIVFQGYHSCHQNPMELEETHLVLGDHCCYLCAPCSIVSYHSLA